MSNDPFTPDPPPGSPLKRAANGGTPPDELAERRRLMLVPEGQASAAPPRPTDRPSRSPVTRTNEPLSMPPTKDLPPMEAFDLGPEDSVELRRETDDPWVFLRVPDRGLLGAFNASRISAMVAAGELADGAEISFDRRRWSRAADIDLLAPNASADGATLVIPPPPMADAPAPGSKPTTAPPQVIPPGPTRASSVAAADGPPLATTPAEADLDAAEPTDVEEHTEPPGGRAGRWLLLLAAGVAAGIAVWMSMPEPTDEPTSTAAAVALVEADAPADPMEAPAAPEPTAAAAAAPSAAPEPAEPPTSEALVASAAVDESSEDGEAQDEPLAAATPTPVDPPAVDAAPAPAEEAEAPVARAAPRRATRGVIAIETGRPLRVRLDGRDTGRTTPTRVRATEGTHTIELVDADGGAVVRRAVRVRSGRTATVDVREQIARLDAARAATARLNDAQAPAPPEAAPEAPTAVAEPTEAAAPDDVEPADAQPAADVATSDRPEATPTEAPAPVAAARVMQKEGGYISVSSSRPLRLYVDGKPTGKRTPVWMFPVDSGDRLVELFDEDGKRVAGRRASVPERQTVPVLFKL